MEQKKFKLIKNEGDNYGYIVDENDVYIQIHAYGIQYIESLQEQLDQTKLELLKEKENHEIDLQNWSNDLKELEPMYNENEKLKNEIEGLDIEVEFLKDENKELKEENERLKTENEKLFNENKKLRCLALHAMSEYCFAQGTIIHTKLEFIDQPIEEDRKMIHKINIRDRWGEYTAKAYHKAKAELMEEMK